MTRSWGILVVVFGVAYGVGLAATMGASELLGGSGIAPSEGSGVAVPSAKNQAVAEPVPVDTDCPEPDEAAMNPARVAPPPGPEPSAGGWPEEVPESLRPEEFERRVLSVLKGKDRQFVVDCDRYPCVAHVLDRVEGRDRKDLVEAFGDAFDREEVDVHGIPMGVISREQGRQDVFAIVGLPTGSSFDDVRDDVRRRAFDLIWPE